MNQISVLVSSVPDKQIINIGLNFYGVEYKYLLKNSMGEHYYLVITCNGKAIHSGDKVGGDNNSLSDMVQDLLEKFCGIKVYNIICV